MWYAPSAKRSAGKAGSRASDPGNADSTSGNGQERESAVLSQAAPLGRGWLYWAWYDSRLCTFAAAQHQPFEHSHQPDERQPNAEFSLGGTLLLCCFAAYFFKEAKYNIPLSVSLGILATFGGMYYKLYTALGDMKKTMALLEQTQNRDAQFIMQILHSFADKLIGTGIGFYLLLAGALLTVIACAACRLVKKQAEVSLGSIFAECRLALTETAEIGSQKIPAYILTILTIAVLVFAAMNVEIFTLKVASLL